MMPLRDLRPQITAQVSAQRRALGAASPLAFAQVYLPHHFRLPMSRMHEELFADLAALDKRRPRRLAVAAPRGHAKSTVVSLAYVLWCAVLGREMHILLVSATKEQAMSLLKTIKTELQTNPMLLADFPEACHPPGARPAPKPWRDNQIVLPNGVAIRAFGAGQSIRGIKHGQHRPGLIIIDDLEAQEHVASAERRDKLRDWFEKTFLKAGSPLTNVILVGTILHYDSLLACIVAPGSLANPRRVSGWTTRKYQAVEAWSANPQLWEQWEAIYTGREQHLDGTGPERADSFFVGNRPAMLEGTGVLWPEMEDYAALMIARVREGRLSFQSEKQNEPLDPTECLFREETFRYWDKDFSSAADVVKALGTHGRYFGACDPSLGQRGGTGDYTAITVVARDQRDKRMYVLVADIARRRPDEIISKVIDYARIYKFKEFVVEANQFQQLLVTQLRDRARAVGLSLNVKPINSTMHKQERIESMEPLVTQGVLKFSIRHQLLLEQLRQFPMGAHDDGPDALHMAVQAAQRPSYLTTLEPF